MMTKTFHSLEQDFSADVGMASLMTMYGFTETPISDADIIIFNGGADIGTLLYSEMPAHPGVPYQPSKRDKVEQEIYQEYSGRDKLLVGICRGSQFLNVMNGGTLWQHVNNHGHTHSILDIHTGKEYMATSTHHQMMRPNLREACIVAVADEATYKRAARDEFPSNIRTHLDDHKDTEIVWYSKSRSLCIQGHPEYIPHSQFSKYCIGLINHYLTESSQND